MRHSKRTWRDLRHRTRFRDGFRIEEQKWKAKWQKIYESEERRLMGIRWSTDIRGEKVYRSDKFEKPQYAIRVSKKEGDSWISEFQEVRFRGSPDIPNRTIVYVKDGFETLKSWVKDGREYTKIIKVAMDYTFDGMTEKPKQSFMEMPEPDLPDSFSSAEDDIPF